MPSWVGTIRGRKKSGRVLAKYNRQRALLDAEVEKGRADTGKVHQSTCIRGTRNAKLGIHGLCISVSAYKEYSLGRMDMGVGQARQTNGDLARRDRNRE